VGVGPVCAGTEDPSALLQKSMNFPVELLDHLLQGGHGRRIGMISRVAIVLRNAFASHVANLADHLFETRDLVELAHATSMLGATEDVAVRPVGYRPNHHGCKHI
jgi:hypothetical protein